jgi:hypothetical protein
MAVAVAKSCCHGHRQVLLLPYMSMFAGVPL